MMSLWDEISKNYSSEIKQSAEEYIKATNILPYTIDDIKSVFRPEDMEELALFIKEMQDASNDNNRKAKLISNNVKIVEGLLKLGKFII
jgi:hypothetical protein